MISAQVIDKIFDAAAIEEVVGEYVTLKRAGSGYRGLCPFHDDKNPSMSVSPSKGIFKCFSCGKGGNVIQFIMEHEGLPYPMAIKFLADKYQIEIDEHSFNREEIEEETKIRDGIIACLEFAKNKYLDHLHHSEEGRLIYKAYLKERGIREESLQKFQIGLSGTQADYLLNKGREAGYGLQQLFDSGLVKKKQDEEGVIEQNLRDVFIDRIVFPIHNVSGKVLGFGGRIIKSDTKAPKYLNSPETLVYEKRKELYGIHQARTAIRMEEEAYLVEGYMDVISLSQSGLENVVAVSGTAFTAEQARLLKRFCQKVIMLFDGDEAGINASLRHMKTLIEADFDVRVVLFPTDEDPDSYMQKHGLSGFREYLKLKEQNFVEFILHILLLNKSEDPIAQAHAARSIAEHVALLKDPLKRTAYISQASRLMSWEEQVLINEVNKMRVQAGRGQKNVEDFQPVFQSGTRHRQVEDKEDYQEKQLLRTLVLHSDKQFDEELSVAGFIFKELEEEELWPATEPYSSVISGTFEHFKEGKTLNEHYFIRHPLSSGMAADILSSKYRLSDAWETNYEKYISTEEKNYKKEVIENLNYLKLHRIEKAIIVNQKNLKEELSDEEVVNLQEIHNALLKLKQKIANEIGAVVLK